MVRLRHDGISCFYATNRVDAFVYMSNGGLKNLLELTDSKKAILIEDLSNELVALRAKAGLSQEELSNILGISRQSYGAFELKKKEMTWRTCFALIMYFEFNPKTQDMLHALDLFPAELNEAKSMDMVTR